MPGPAIARPCRTCGQICWQCQNQFDRAKAELERLEEVFATLRLAYAEAGDADAPAISNQLAEVQDAIDEAADALSAIEEGEHS